VLELREDAIAAIPVVASAGVIPAGLEVLQELAQTTWLFSPESRSVSLGPDYTSKRGAMRPNDGLKRLNR